MTEIRAEPGEPRSIRGYLRGIQAEDRSGGPSFGLSSLVRHAVPRALRPHLKVALTRGIMPLALLAARRQAGRGEILRLHLGCGATRLSGWTNVDFVGTGADWFWDLKFPLPFPVGSTEAIFHEHLLEHLPLEQAVRLTQDCWTLLKRGGVLRIGVPDFRKYSESYMGDGQFIEALRPGRPTRLLALAEVVYRYDHRSVWDGETLSKLLGELGFRDVRVRSFGESMIQPPPDSEHRRAETLYVESVR